MTNFDRYVSESSPTGLSKLDVYKSQNLLKVLESLSSSIKANIASGMFEDEMLKELRDIKSLLKTDVLEALKRANDYAPTVDTLTAGTVTASPFPKVDTSDMNWLTEKRVTNYTVLAHNLALIKKLWNQAPDGVQAVKPLVVPVDGSRVRPSYDSPSFEESLKKSSALSEEMKRQRDLEAQREALKEMYKKSRNTVYDQFKWMTAPVSPYLELIKNVWDVAKPLRKSAALGLKSLRSKKEGVVSLEDIDDSWVGAQEARQKKRAKRSGVTSSSDPNFPEPAESQSPTRPIAEPTNEPDLAVGSSSELQPEVLAFPSSISVDNFSEFEAWLEEWLKPMLDAGYLTDVSMSESLKRLADTSEAQLALLLYISETLGLTSLRNTVYDAGVDKVMKDQGLLEASPGQGILSASTDEGLLPGSTESGLLPEAQGVVMALPGHELSLPAPSQSLLPESAEQEEVLPAVVERASSVSVSDSDDVPVTALPERGVTSLGVEEVQASAEPVGDSVLWSSVRSKFRNRVIEDAEFEDITDVTQQQEVERDKQQQVIDSTKALFDGLRESIDELRKDSKRESDQTQDILEDLTGENKESPLGTFLSSLMTGFTSLFSGMASFFNPAMIAGIGALIAYFSSEGFRNFINGIGKFAWDKVKDFFDSNKRDSTTEEIGGVAGGVSRVAPLGSKALGAASNKFGHNAKVADRAVKVAEAGGKGTTALKAVSATNKAAAALSRLSSSGLGKVAKGAGGLAAGVEFLNTGLGFMGLDSEANEMSAAGNYNLFKDLEAEGLVVDDAFAKSAGLDNMTWKDYVSSAFNGASLGALVGGGVASPITAALGATGAVFAMSEEAKNDYRAFAKENPKAFLQMIAAKKAGVSLDRVSFKDAKGKGTEGFVQWLQDNQSEIKDAMSYSKESKQGLYNTLMGVWYASRANPGLSIKDLPFKLVTDMVMPYVSADPVISKGKVSDVNVSVRPIDLPGRKVFVDNVEDALSGDLFRTDRMERAKITRRLEEAGDDPEGVDSPSFGAYTPNRIKIGNGIKKKNLGVNTEGVTNPNIVDFVNGLSNRSDVGDVVITSGFRGVKEQEYLKNRKNNKYSTSKSPHMKGRAVDFKISRSLAGFFASKEGYNYLVSNNIDPHFLWGEVDTGKDSHFHVQLRQPNKWNDLFYSENGWDHYKVYADLRLAKLGTSGYSYEADRDKMLAMTSEDIKGYKPSGSGYSPFMGKPTASGGSFLDATVVAGVEDSPGSKGSTGGEWYSGIVDAIDSLGTPFKVAGDIYQATVEAGDSPAVVASASTAPSYKFSESRPSRLRTPALNTDLLLGKGSDGVSQQGTGGSTVVSAPSSTQVSTTNNIVNVKSNLYTKQS